MTTKKQIEANRRNAKLSTGPITAAGRAQSSKNALKHGLTAEDVTVNPEEAAQFTAFRDRMSEDLAPLGPLEEELVRRIIIDSWRLRRVPRLEIAHTVHHETSDLGVKVSEGPRYQFMASGSCHHLIRYETSIGRSLQRAFHELERLQARRRGEAVGAPIALDITHWVDGGPIMSPPTTGEEAHFGESTAMTTKKQIEANQRNAKLSTGPITAAGRAQSSKNALKHGLTAEDVTVNPEEAAQFTAFRDAMVEDFATLGPLEEELVRRIIIDAWRLRRVPRLEIAHTVHHETSDLGVKVSEGPRYQFLASGSCDHLIRYESHLGRSLQRAFRELERLQARRQGEAVAPPIGPDLTQWADGGLGAPSIFSPPTTCEEANGHGLKAAVQV